jgi:SAM-dependent methyltransferase
VNRLDYQQIFDARGESYNRACIEHPQAREEERQQLIRRLHLPADGVFCDAPAGGGYLSDGVNQQRGDITVYCIEPSTHFSKQINPAFTILNNQLDSILLPYQSVDALGSLAGLHHIVDRLPVFSCWHQRLKPGGVLAVADVELGSDVGKFLNGFVDRYTPDGHDGYFFRGGEFSELMAHQGLVDIEETFEPLHWQFGSRLEAASFCRDLFYLQGIALSDIALALEQELGLCREPAASGWMLPWGLRYASGKKLGNES